MGRPAKTILLVEDEAIIALDEIKFLNEEGYNVIHALSGEEAITIVQSSGNNIDLILMDVELGSGMDGSEAAGEILKNHEIPVVFLSSHMEKEFVEKTEKNTPYGYILKNSGNNVLSASIKMACKIFKSRQDLKLHAKELEASVEKLNITISELKNENHLLKKNNTRGGAGIGLSDSELRYKQLMENAGEAIYIVQDKRLKYANPKTMELTGYTIEELSSHSFIEFIHHDDRELVMENHLKRIKGDFITHVYQFRIIHKDGTIRWIELNAILFGWGGKPATLNFVTDVTDKKHAEKLITELNCRYEEAMQTAKMAYWEFDIPSRIFCFNERFYRMYGISLENTGNYEMSLNTFADKYIANEFVDQFTDVINQAVVFSNPYYQNPAEILMMRDNGEELWVSMCFYAEKDQTGSTIKLHGVNQDITERRSIEESLKSSKEILSIAVELAKIGPWEYDFKTDNFTFSDEFYSIYGTSVAREGLTMTSGKYVKEFLYPDRAFLVRETIKNILKSNNSGYPVLLEHNNRIIRRDGEVRTIKVLSKIIRNSRGEILKWYGANQDITDQNKAQEKLKSLVNEKEILLKELQHRIKNNLTIISSLLSLGMRNITDEKARSIFTDAISRISSMTHIYEQLYSSDNIDKIDLNAYINNLADSIFKTYNIELNKCYLTLSLADISLEIKNVVPLGLILNELIANSLKYAYPGNTGGEIRVFLQKKDDFITLIVSDDGIGLPEGFNIEKSKSMGFMLVSILTKQIEGDLKIDGETGTRVSISFRP